MGSRFTQRRSGGENERSETQGFLCGLCDPQFKDASHLSNHPSMDEQPSQFIVPVLAQVMKVEGRGGVCNIGTCIRGLDDPWSSI